jgi:hypothetical protein
MRTAIPFFVLATLAGCTAKSSAPSTVSGTLTMATFPLRPSAVAAVDEAGKRITTTLGGDAHFAINLAKGHTYRLLIVKDGSGTVPVVFPRAAGRLDATFVLRTNGARISLGAVRYLGQAPAGGFKVQSAAQSTSDAEASDNSVEDTQQTTCDDGQSGDTGGDNGATGSTGANDTADQADANQEMAVGDQNAPDQVAGCDTQDGENSDVQQEGEH